MLIIIEENKQYNIKIPFEIVDQIGLLKRLDLTIDNINYVKLLLEDNAFQRYKPYIHHLLDKKSGKFKKNRKFNDLEVLRGFEKKLRFLLLEELENIENDFKHKIRNTLVKFRVTGFNLSPKKSHPISSAYKIVYVKDEARVVTLKDEKDLGDIDEFIDNLSFGSIFNLYQSLDIKIKSKIIKNLNLVNIKSIKLIDFEVLMSIFVDVRNKCAHYKSIIDYSNISVPEVAKILDTDLKYIHSIGPVFYLIHKFVSNISTKLAEHSDWQDRVENLFESVNLLINSSSSSPLIYEITNLVVNNPNWKFRTFNEGVLK